MFGSNRRALTRRNSAPFRRERALRLDGFQDTRYLRKIFGKASRRGQRDRQPERKDDPVAIPSPIRVAIAMTPLSRKGNKRRATNRRGWRQRHVVAVLCSSRLFLSRGEDTRKRKRRAAKRRREWKRLLIPGSKISVRHLTLRFLIGGLRNLLVYYIFRY